MPWIEFIWEWDDPEGNVAHLALHDVVPEEAEHVVMNPQREELSESSGRPIRFGYTRAGRYIAVVFEWIDVTTVYPITAYDAEDQP